MSIEVVEELAKIMESYGMRPSVCKVLDNHAGKFTVVSEAYLGHNESLREVIHNTESIKHSHFDKYSTSVVISGVEVEIFRKVPESVDFALKYYSYNGLGLILSRLARAYGLTMESGQCLSYLIRSGREILSDIVVTRNFSDCLRDLGYGELPEFTTELEIFEYLASSSLFHPSNFNLANISEKVRGQMQLCKLYTNFFNYLKENYKDTVRGDSRTIVSHTEYMKFLRELEPDFSIRLVDSKVWLDEHTHYNSLYNDQTIIDSTSINLSLIDNFKNYLEDKFKGKLRTIILTLRRKDLIQQFLKNASEDYLETINKR